MSGYHNDSSDNMESVNSSLSIKQISCPPGFSYTYSVKPGDTMYQIAKQFGISIEELIAANPQIVNPALIYPGQVLCVPTELTLPCCYLLNPASDDLTPPPGGSFLVERLADGNQSVSILAVRLPQPQQLGPYNSYEAFISIPEVGGYGGLLFPVGNETGTWAGDLTLPPVLRPGSFVIIRPVNTAQNAPGNMVVLAGAIEEGKC